jgi:uncharacterized SAM-binding protein YcdF (DUF218 family)
MLISPVEAQRITQYIDVTAETEKADLLFVFGTMLLEPAYIAADAVACDRAKYVVLTGGNNRFTGVNEAEAHLQILLERGVPRERIIVENESRNTRENVLFALPHLMKCLDLDGIGSIMVLTKWHHCRRAMMTLKRHLPAGTRYYSLSYEQGGATRSGWWNNEEGYTRVMGNWNSIQEYLGRDHLAQIWKENGAYI